MPGSYQILRLFARQRQALTDLALIDANYSGGWMGLPQELVGMIFEYLRTDRDALVPCSLTCRALFCSVRRIIHERLYVAGPRMSPFINKLAKWCWISNRKYLRTLSLADDADLVQYTRHLVVEAGQAFSPRSLRSYIPTFRKYVWLTSLTLTRFDPTPFLPAFDHYFRHLSHSLRSLVLISPQGVSNTMTNFVSRFRNLDDLGFNPVPKPPCRPQKRQISLGPRRWFTPLGGTLCIVNTDSRRANSLDPLFHFPGGLRFRSLQFICCTNINTAGIMRKCSSTLESVMYRFHCRKSASFASNDNLIFTTYLALESTFLQFNFRACLTLRVFEARIDNLSCALGDLIIWLAGVLSTIKSPVFSKFILSLDYTTLEPHVYQLNATTTNPLDRWRQARSGLQIRALLPSVVGRDDFVIARNYWYTEKSLIE
ncbi:hypothetical protein BDM02DRAFT_3221070 [Thelephora ganbajun]|uniref:Uncharacterized protein n=1 Tax=Thelephora ganbajun TaxID=370292 RepID=A0ACB6ZLP8_THEGA|nr:hypothetical protein BDM02DRAFT_3221070 [Thelephora ganbajun]